MKPLRNFFLPMICTIIAFGLNAQIAKTDSSIKPKKFTSWEKGKTELPSISKEIESVYIDSMSRVYVNKNLPIYLKFSTAPNGKTYDLKSLKHPEDTEPFYLDTEGPNYIRTKWALDPQTKEYAYPLREIEMELYADSKPPMVNPIFSSTHSYRKTGVIYYGSDLEIDMKEWDEQAGVKNSYWSLNKADWKEGKLSFEGKSSGDYSFAYYSVDNVNNYTDPVSSEFIFDNTAPKTDLLKTEEGTYVFGPRTPLQFQVEEVHSGKRVTYFSIDEFDQLIAKEGLVLPIALEDGEYDIQYYSIDNVRNEEEVNQTKIYLDKIAPETSLMAAPSHSKGKRLYISGTSKINLEATDNKAGVREIKFNTRGFTNSTYDEAISLENFHGLTSINYQATDIVSNKERRNYQEIFVDTLRPSTKMEFIGDYFEVANRYYVNEATKLKFSSSDLNAGVAYTEYGSIGSEFKKYDGPFNITEEGYNGLMYRSVDNVENTEYSQSIDLYLDKKGPEIVFNFSNRPMDSESGIPVYAVGTRLFLGATDDQSGTNTISYQINDQNEVHYSSPKTIDISEKKAFKKGQTYDIQITTTDLVNNKTTEVISFKIEG